MIETIHTINILLPIFYFLTFLIYLYDFQTDDKLTKSKRFFLSLTLVVHLVYILLRTIEFDHPPITNVFEVFTLLAFSVSFSYLILELVTNIRGTGLFIIILSFAFQIVSSLFIKDLFQVREELRSNLLGIHVFSALIGYAGITISAVYGFLYLLLYDSLKQNKFGLLFDRLPNLEILEKLCFYSAVIGFILLTIAITIGIIWLPQTNINFSYTDPKLLGTFLIWIIYGIGILRKFYGKLRGRKLVIVSIIGFLLTISSTILSNFLAKSFHSFY
ncbi:MAG: cytochrome c biogenesis protein [Ignavibacterium sp.]|nr:cytochrome c biogenesis protein [Ignavibacterium sp.]MDW8375558.1 cytochrome c biogenesis protein CcsA [Ignavibacteriales bacterium]